MTTPAEEKHKARLVLSLVLLLLIASGAGVGFTLGLHRNEGRNAGNEPEQAAARTNAAPRTNPTAADVNGAPTNAPTNEPAEKLKAGDPVALPPMSRFRRLVLEADTVLELAGDTPPAAKRIESLDDVLRALDSRFAVYSSGLRAGDLSVAEASQFRQDAGESFLKPDVGAAAYAVEAAPRVCIWLRQGARVPAAEKQAPAGVVIPLSRRLQETVTAGVAAGWLDSMEAEFGPTDFGKDGGIPFDIVVFSSAAEYLDFSRRRLRLNVPSWSAGYFSTAWDVACAPVMEQTSLAEVLRHEMFHAIQGRLAPQSLFVPWFGEGTAEWLDKHAPVSGKPATDATFRLAAYGYLAGLIDQGYALNLREFLARDVAAFYAQPELNYLVAYCFVDFLRGEQDLREVYFAYWKQMVAGTSADEAFGRTFGLLNMDDVQRRFLEKLRAEKRQPEAPRFTHDGVPEKPEAMPAALSGGTAPPARDGAISDSWYAVLGKLQKAGIDTTRAPYFKGEFELVVVAIDHSESMAAQLDPNTFNFSAFGRWLYSMRYAGSMQFTRREGNRVGEEEVPAAVLMALVEAVLTNKTAAFVEAAGVKVSEDMEDDIRKGYKTSGLLESDLKRLPKRDLCAATAESMAWVWGVQQTSAKATVVDFHTIVAAQTASTVFRATGTRSSSNAIRQMFAETERMNPPKPGMQGIDTDWQAGLNGLIEACKARGTKRVACMFFTDGPNSAGFYGLSEPRNDDMYAANQRNLAKVFAQAWVTEGLDVETQSGVLQLFALPGAEGQKLDEIAAACPQAKLDEWWPRFRK